MAEEEWCWGFLDNRVLRARVVAEAWQTSFILSQEGQSFKLGVELGV